MSDKIRGALFNILGDIDGLSVLDSFAGSGALGFEALSRGAPSVLMVESDKSAQRAIAENIQALGLGKQAKLVKANVGSWSDNNPAEQFDLVLCDPPYDKLQLTLLQKLVRHVAAGGTYVLSWPGKLAAPEFVGMEMVANKTYGDSQLVFFTRMV
jgi:16S rRNA (guanine966-N2)-methyltransferase